MTPEQQHVYIDEIYLQAELALMSFSKFEAVVNDPDNKQNRIAWMHLQSFLSHFGMVSKYLFAPSAKKKISKRRASHLRDVLNLNNNSPINDRNARNAVEHLDERLDHWLYDEEEKGILEAVFDTHANFNFLSKDRWKVRRVYIIESSTYISEETDGPQEMQLQPLVDELTEVRSRCLALLENDNPYHML